MVNLSSLKNLFMKEFFVMENTNVRLTDPNMTVKDMLVTMCDGNPGALSAMMKMLERDQMQGTLHILLCDSLGIYGSKIYMLWNDCCGRDMEKLDETFAAFSEGKFTREQIHENLGKIRATPFI